MRDGHKTMSAIALSLRLHDLQQRKAEIIAPIDAEIDSVISRLAALTGEKPVSRDRLDGSLTRGTRITGQPSTDEPVTQKVLEALAAHPGAEYGALALKVYGREDDRTREKVRNVIYYLQRQKRVRKLGKKRGRWKVAPPEISKEEP